MPENCKKCKTPMIGVEIQGEYDGISYWKCPKCHRKWDRWTGKEITDLAKHTFDRFNKKKRKRD